jgi:hypothetical protein
MHSSCASYLWGPTMVRATRRYRTPLLLSRVLTGSFFGVAAGTAESAKGHYYNTSRKVASSIPDELIGFFN